jgi:hypothetical protein
MSDEYLSNISVVILTTPFSETDVPNACEFHANSYRVKLNDFSQFFELTYGIDYHRVVWNKDPTGIQSGGCEAWIPDKQQSWF